MNPRDPLSRVLYIDLEHRRFWTRDRRDLFERWLGGTGVAIQLLKEELPRDADPLSPKNVIVFAVGPLTATYPFGSKTVAMFKSPLTGNLGESHAGGRSATSIRLAGYGAIVIKGASDTPIYLVVDESGAYFRDASALWGITSTLTVGRILREATLGQGYRSIMRIGRAGERLVRYAAVMTETYRHFGRLGLGAVFGSKKLKAIVIRGGGSVPIYDKREYREVYKQVFELAVKSDLMKKYHDLGTPMNILPLNKIGALPTRNLTSARFEEAEKISGERIAEEKLGRRLACSNCPIACIHLAALKEPYPDEPYFYKTTFISYDYEPIYALGTMLGISDIDGLLKLLDVVEVYGLDAMSTGVCLAWATEAFQRGIITRRETIVELKWGDYENYIKAAVNIVDQPNEFYEVLAKGVEKASERYGGREFALSFGGNEMPGYHTGYGAHIGFLIGSRHSHLDCAGYSLDQKLKEPLPPRELVERLIEEESWRQILSSLVVCFFARGIYKPEMVVKALKTLGYDYDVDGLRDLGREIYEEKQRLKHELGFKPEALRPPERVLETESPHGTLKIEYFDEALKVYREMLSRIISQG
ncbi:MAG: aldehyde ferredoxin oxidoreductase family protein [Thaumarchaeota archaeon]|nr:aldehyde ferredoxin oxidoreductase family protein [Nitrososphaerota archaeon]